MAAQHTPAQLAVKAYEAYGRATGGRNYRGEPMPDYEDLSIVQQAAWIEAVTTVRDIVFAPES
jgi:hypothetical protein